MSLLYEGHNLRKEYGGAPALDLPSFYLNRGEVLTITGPNGSGKSTLLRLLAFLEKPSSGSLVYYGGDRPRQEATLLLQEPYLFRDSVFRNVVLGLILRGQRSNLEENFERAMRLAGFDNPQTFAMRKPGELSGGEKQRIALASRLILKPLALLLDEPTTYVDQASATAIVRTLEIFAQSGSAIVCATHDRALITTLGARNLHLQ